MNKEARAAEALAAIDRAHADDPAGKELDYARRMSAWLERLCSQPDPLLAIAVRAQHLKRWECSRSLSVRPRGLSAVAAPGRQAPR